MTPSVSLPYGFVFVYGTGTDIGLAGNYATDTVFKFGTIYGVGVNMGSEIIGNSICFDSRKVVCQLAWANYPYSVVNYDVVIATEVFL